MIFIRKATEADLATVLELIQELARFEKEPDAVEITIDDLKEQAFGSNPLIQILLAETDEKIIGMALFYYRFSTWKGKTIHLEDLIVRHENRGSGAGSKLYSEILKIAHKEQIKRVEWVVLNWNHEAITFYEKTGAQILPDWNTVQMDEKGIKNYINSL